LYQLYCVDLETCARTSVKPALGLAFGSLTTLPVEKENLVSGKTDLVVTYISAAAGWCVLAILLNLLDSVLYKFIAAQRESCLSSSSSGHEELATGRL
jgi:hypothetical protein